ncbi:tape measure protein [Rhodococcus hoagii]|nr:tape measure protein [Prescottella equi]
MAIELATGFISIVPETSKIAPGIKSALAGVDREAVKAGEGFGSKIAGGLSKTLKVGAAGVGVAAAAGIGTALTKGFQRLSAIDEASAKLSALGNSTQDVQKIMDNALASVKGTAFGLGDAAGLAGTMVASGIKPGQELETVLKRVADSAAVSGSTLEDMGLIWGKAAAKGKLDGEIVAQLLERQIPIYDILGKKMGKNAEEVADMVSKGKVSFKDFSDAMNDKLGGGAVKMGDSFKGAVDNMGAALGRLGAGALEPTFGRIAGWLGTATGAIDGATPKVKEFFKAFDAKVFDEWAPKVIAFGSTVRDGFNEFKNSSLVVDSTARLKDVFFDLAGVAKEVAPAVGAISQSLATAAAATGVGSWHLLLTALEAVAPILETTLVPALQLTADLMQNNQGLVTALALGFAAFKTVPSIMGPVLSVTDRLKGGLGSAKESVGSFGGAIRESMVYARQANPEMGKFGQAMTVVGGNAKAAAKGIGSMASSALGFLGGPLGVALIGGTIAWANYSDGVQKAERQQTILSESASKAADAQKSLMEAMAGGDAKTIQSQLVSNLAAVRQEQESLASTGPSALQQSAAGWDRLGQAIGVTRGESYEAWKSQQDIADSAGVVSRTLNDLGVTNDRLAAAVSGSTDEYMRLRTEMSTTGGSEAAQWLDDQRTKYQQTAQAMKDIGPAGVELTSALAQIGDAAGDSDKKLDGMKRALQALGILQSDAQEAAFETAQAVREIGEEASKGWDAGGGLGEALLGKDSLLSGAANAAKLNDELKRLGGLYLDMVASGKPAQEAFDSVAGGLQALSDASGLAPEKIRELAEALGGIVPPDLADKLAAPITSADQAITQLQLRSKELSEKPIMMQVEDEGVRNAIRGIEGLKVEATGTPGVVKITAENQEAIDKLNQVKIEAQQFNTLTAVPRVDLHTELFRQKLDHANSLIDFLGKETPSPEADLIIGKLRENKQIADGEIDKLTARIADPQVRLEIGQALRDANTINGEINKIPAVKNVRVVVSNQWDPAARAAALGAPNIQGPFADGGIRQYADGGIQNLPERAIIQQGRGSGLVQWAEGETGGEAFIPLAESKRGRSTAILSEVAKRFGYKLEAFADGGIRAAVDAARSVTGNTYLWGGTGPTGFDCSGFMGWLQQILMGASPASAAGKRLYTTYSLLDGATSGLVRGAGPAGTAFVVGVSQEHMAGTLAGQPVESGGAHGTSRIGAPAVGAFDSQFGTVFHLPNELVAGGVGTGIGGAITGEKPEWTEKDQLDLESARISVQQAKESRDKVYGAEKKSDADRQQADLSVQRAELKVRELEAKRDGTGVKAMSDTPAPPLTGAMGDDAITLRNAEISVLDAQLSRDKTYNDPDSTSLDKEKADLQVFQAQNSLEATKKRVLEDAGKTGTDGLSLKDRMKKFGSDVAGIAVDSILEIFGVQTRWLDIPIPEFKAPPLGATVGGSTPGEMLKSILPAGIFPQSEINSQLPVTPGAPNWVDGFLKALPPGLNVQDAISGPWDMLLKSQGGKIPLHDEGGWLMPGLTMNLTKKPEPVLNPEQLANLRKVANLDTQAMAPTGGRAADSWRPGVQITNQITVSNDRSQVRKFREENAMLLMQYGGAR